MRTPERRALPLLLAVVVTLLAMPASGARWSFPLPADDAGRLRNLAQQQLGARDLDGADGTLQELLKADPEDGFSAHLLSQLQILGRNHGVEAVAVWAELARQKPERPELLALHSTAELELHRNDKFLGPSSEWLVAALERLGPVTAPDQPIRARYEAHLARRNLLNLVKQRQAARQEGLAAHAALGSRLQGRISLLLQQVSDKDLAGARASCLSVLETDPWAAEACSTLWSLQFPDDPARAAAAEQARDEVLGAVTHLEATWLGDPVTAHELIKFRERIGDKARVAELLAEVRKVDPEFAVVSTQRWWRRPVVVGVPYRAMNVATSKALQLPTPPQRLEALLARWHEVPADGDADWGLRRYLNAVARAAAEVGDAALPHRLAALRALIQGTPDDADALLELARAQADAGDVPQALSAVRASAEAILATPWDPLARPGRQTFAGFVGDQLPALTARAALEEELLGAPPTIAPGRAWPPATDGHAWLQRGAAAAKAGDPDTALELDLEGLARMTDAEAQGVPRKLLRGPLLRFRDAFPQVDAFGGDARAALLAAAAARREARRALERGEDPGGHPFVGRAPPALSGADTQGQPFDLAGLRGRVVVVDFWATWCGPCKKAMPELQGALQNLRDEPVTFLMLSVDETLDVVDRFVADSGYSFRFAHIGPTGTKEDWLVKGIPSTFILGPDGRVAAHHQGFRSGAGASIEQEIRTLLPPGDPR